jgi:hypothetical protein
MRVILLGAVALTFDLWLQLHEILRQRQPIRLHWQGVAYVTASFATNITACSAPYLVGYFGHLVTTAKGGASTCLNPAGKKSAAA